MQLSDMQKEWDSRLISHWNAKHDYRMGALVAGFIDWLIENGAELPADHEERKGQVLKELGLRRTPIPNEMYNTVAGFIGNRSMHMSTCLLGGADKTEILAKIHLFRWCKPNPGKAGRDDYIQKSRRKAKFIVRVRERDKGTNWKTVK